MRSTSWCVGLSALLGTQFVLPCAAVYAQTQPAPVAPGLDLGDGPTTTLTLGNGAHAPTITKIGNETPRLKVKPSASTGCGPGGNCDVTTKPLDLSRPPTEKELRMAGQMGGALSPLFSADVPKWEKKFDTELKAAGIPHGIQEQVAPVGLERDAVSLAVNEKKTQLKRLKKMNLEFGEAMQKWNKHAYRDAAKDMQGYLKEYPESPWAGEVALHLGCDAKYNGRFNEAQDRFQEILDHTSADPKDPSWEIHQKAKLRWADLDLALGRFGNATEKLGNLLQTEQDWRRKAWERYWMRSASSQSQDARVLRACGTKALGFVLASVGKKDRADALARMTPTRQAGFSLAELSILADRNGAPMQGFRASVAEIDSLPLPFIIHYDFGDAKRAAVQKKRGQMWPVVSPVASRASKTAPKTALFPAPALQRSPVRSRSALDAPFHASEQAGHFLVVSAVEADRHLVHLFDPQEGRHYTLSYAQLEEEWSGAGLKLVKSDSSPHSPLRRVSSAASARPLVRLSMAEMRRYVGGCCGVARALFNMGPSGSGSPCGSPVWSVDPIGLNLNVYDIPLWYQTPIGPDVQISMSYNAADGLNQNQTLGNKWAFNYGSYLVEDTGDGGGVITIFMPQGQQDNYLPLPNNTFKSDRPDNLNRLKKVGLHRFELYMPSGTTYVYDIPANSNSMQQFLVEERDQYGYALRFGYDGDNRLRTVTDAQNKVTQLWYDAVGHLVRARTPQGCEGSWSYDVNGNMVGTIDIEGNPFGYVYDKDVRLTELVTVQGSWKFKHEGPDNGRQAAYPPPDTDMWAAMRITITNPLEQKEEYFYNGYFDRKYWHVGPRFYTPYKDGNVNNASAAVPKTSWVVQTLGNGYGKVSQVWAPSTDGGQTSQSTSTVYDPSTGWPSAITDSRGRTTGMSRNAMGQVTSVSDWQNRTSRLDYAPNGLDVTRVTDWRGKVQAEMTYSGLGQVATMTTPASIPNAAPRQVAFTYTPWGMPLTITTGQGQSGFTYGADGQLTGLSRNGTSLGSFVYDAKGRMSGAQDADGKTAGYSYDELDNVRKVTFSDGSSTETEAVCCGLPGAVKDRAGRWTYYDYDALKRPTRVQDTAGNTLDTDYDANGNMVRLVDAKGKATQFVYDALDRLIAKRYADNSISRWSYDAYGRLSARQDAKGGVTRYKYDSNDNLLGIDYPNMPDVSFAYDDRERPVRSTDAVGTTRLTYDDLDRVKAIDGPFDSDTVTYGYDSLGRASDMSVSGFSGSGGDQVSYGYDSLGRLGSLTSQAGVFNYVYNGVDAKLSQLQLPNGSRTNYGYDTLNRLNSVENKKGTGEVISRYAYGYEGQNASGDYQKRGLRTSVDLQMAALGSAGAYSLDPAQKVDYSYSGDNQLTGESATKSAATQGGAATATWNRAYGYDTMGNRLASSTKSEDQTQTSSTAYTPNALNQIASLSTTSTTTGSAAVVTQSALQYDESGNLSQSATTSGGTSQGKASYAYDDLNRLSEMVSLNAADVPQSKSSFVYDAASRKRIAYTFSWSAATSAWTKTSEKRYIYDGMNVVQERDGNNVVTATYTWAGGVGGLLSRRTFNPSSGAATGVYFYHYDGGGNVTGLSDATQNIVARYRYDAFGNALEANGSQAGQPFRFSTKEAVGGLYDFGYRFYDPGMGRWLNRDPIKEAGGLNLYGFAGNNPVNFVDPLGLCVTPLQMLTIAAFAFVAVTALPAFGVTLGLGAILGVSVGAGIGFGVANESVGGQRRDGLSDAVSGLGSGLTGFTYGVAALPYLQAGGFTTIPGAGGGCFVAGTPIVMADGSSKPIEQVKKGDSVLSRDEKSGKTEAKNVEGVSVRQVADTRTLTFADGSRVETTDEHPFYVEGKGFSKAKEIGIGSSIVTRAGPALKLVQNKSTGHGATVYNFTVEGTHSYFIGQKQAWVHNTDPLDCPHPLEPEQNLFRGDDREPSEIFKDGFTARGRDMDIYRHALGNSDSGYVSTSTSRAVAADNGGYDINVYALRASGVNVPKIIGSDPYHELEIAVPGHIPASSVEGVHIGDVWHPNPNWRP